jgi:hypothetical protein
LDRIGAAFGVFSPRSLHELDEESERIDGMVEQLKTHGKAWQNTRESVARANLDRFVETHPEWKDRLADTALATEPRPEIDAVTAELLPAMEADVTADPALDERFRTVRDNAERAKAIGYRMEVRQGVVLRMRALLVALAGRVYLQAGATEVERATYDALRPASVSSSHQCLHRPVRSSSAPTPSPSWPTTSRSPTASCRRGSGPVPTGQDALRTEYGLADGAASVMMVYDDSPARAAGLQEGDVVLGPPGAPFVEKDQIREWTMRSPRDVPADLEILRDGTRQVVSLVLAAMPQKWPSLPGPPKVGSVAPPLRLDPYRGEPPTSLADGRSRLLFFWATWCTICKEAVPEMLAFGAARDTEIVAITGRRPPELDPFFAEWKAPSPPGGERRTRALPFAATESAGRPHSS